jgi:hypothetical protein
MKTLVSVLIAGALAATSALAGAGNDSTMATPHVPFRPLNKRPSGARQAVVVKPRANVATPQLPFRLYQKRPTAAPSNKPGSLEATAR